MAKTIADRFSQNDIIFINPKGYEIQNILFFIHLHVITIPLWASNVMRMNVDAATEQDETENKNSTPEEMESK